MTPSMVQGALERAERWERDGEVGERSTAIVLAAEVKRLKKALQHIASADCWNSKVTAQDALKGESW